MASTSFVDLVTLTAAAWFNDVDIAAYSHLTSVSGTNTIVGTGPVPMGAYAAGQIFRGIAAATNTGATTLNITPSGGSALGAKNVYFGGAACAGGEIVINVPFVVIYDGTQFNLIGTNVATQAQQETGTIVSVAVTPGRQQYHPSAAKAWINCNGAGTSITASYNVTSITDTGTGNVFVNLTTSFSGTAYNVMATAEQPGGSTAGMMTISADSLATGGWRMLSIRVSDAALTDPTSYRAVAFGDQ